MTDLERLRNITQQDRELNSWAFRSFRDVADGDYIAARMAYRAQLPVQFLWASQQAIEKYLKCALFIRRKAAKTVRHALALALKLLEDSRWPETAGARHRAPRERCGDEAGQLARRQSLGGRQWKLQIRMKGLFSVSDRPIRGRQPPPFVAATVAASAVAYQGFQRGLDHGDVNRSS